MIIAILLLLPLSIWVGNDADSRGMNGFGWGVAVFLVMIIALPLYFVTRGPKIIVENEIIDDKNYKEQLEFDQEYSNFSDKEKKEIKRFIDYGLKSGEKLVINNENRNVDRFDRKDWNEILENNQQHHWLIIKENTEIAITQDIK